MNSGHIKGLASRLIATFINTTPQKEILLDQPVQIEFEGYDDDAKHPHSDRSALYKLRDVITNQNYFLKVHLEVQYFEREVYFYVNCASSVELAPKLIGYDVEHRALLVSALEGRSPQSNLDLESEKNVWFKAGEWLKKFHGTAHGCFFGVPKLDGEPFEAPVFTDNRLYLDCKFRGSLEKAMEENYVDIDEIQFLSRLLGLIDSFPSEVPVPCHGDYFPVNWLVNEQGDLTGIIDFEFSEWNSIFFDFSRDADWNWIHKPTLFEAIVEGYFGGPLNVIQQKQLLVFRALYALNAIVWGHQNSFFGFEKEGHEALKFLQLNCNHLV